jgi:hypothetical protein
LIARFVRENKIKVLNVAGPRQSEWADGYSYASRALDIFLTRLGPPDGITRSAALSPDRVAPRSKRGSAPRSSR